MAERVFTSGASSTTAHPNWGAIWAGTFSFVAIWSIFGFLGAAIFASVASPATPLTTMGAGMGIWAVLLTMIAMFVGGRVAGRASDGVDAVMTGTATFGLSVTAALLVLFLARVALIATTALGGVLSAYSVRMLAGLGWAGFFALILGWLAAMAGARSSMPNRTVASTSEPVRRVA